MKSFLELKRKKRLLKTIKKYKKTWSWSKFTLGFLVMLQILPISFNFFCCYFSITFRIRNHTALLVIMIMCRTT